MAVGSVGNVVMSIRCLWQDLKLFTSWQDQTTKWKNHFIQSPDSQEDFLSCHNSRMTKVRFSFHEVLVKDISVRSRLVIEEMEPVQVMPVGCIEQLSSYRHRP